MPPIREAFKPSHLDPSRITQASALLARAFHNDPLQTHVFPDPQQRRDLSPAHFEPMVRYGYLAGEVWTIGDPIQGIAIWWPPSHTSIDLDLMDQVGFFKLADTIGPGAFHRFTAMLDYVDPFHHQDLPGPHWYAMVIGVDPSQQGKGIGGSLLEPVLNRADHDGLPCYLETCQPANVPFYRKHGFTVLREGTEPGSGLAYWTFKRDPRPR